MKHGPYKHIGKGKERSPAPERPFIAATILPRDTCNCESGKCRHAARECRDWIKRSATK